MSTCMLVASPSFLIKRFWAAATTGSLLLALAASCLLHLGREVGGVLHRRCQHGGGGSCYEVTGDEIF
jgi:hypothetical protein